VGINKLFIFFLILFFATANSLFAQEEDYSQYENMETAGEPVKTFCTSKIVGLSPSKLITVGYDFQTSNTLNAAAYRTFSEQTANIKYNSGLRLAANVPVISNVKWLLSLGANLAETKYEFESNTPVINPLVGTLKKNGLTTMGLNGTLFKPLNSKLFILGQTSFDWNGDYSLGTIPSANQLKVSAAILVGKKEHERRMIAYGVTRTYRGGQTLYLPILLYNYTFTNRKWGIECLLPARGAVRYTLNSRNMFFAGFELEGNSYRLNQMMKDYSSDYKYLELRRSEIRTRITYEFSVYKFIWLSVQAGYRINYKYKMDEGEFFGRKRDFVAENKLSNPFYFLLSLNLVSP